MRKINLLAIVVILLCICGCEKIQTVEDYKKIYEEDVNNVENACVYIDSLILSNDMDGAYKVFNSISSKVKSEEDINKVREFTKYFEKRLVEIQNKDPRDNSQEIHQIRYDENGRKIHSGETVYYYPDDGSDVYYYVYDFGKTGYDKEGNILIKCGNNWYSEEEPIKKYNDEYDYAYIYEYERDDNDNIIKRDGFYWTGDSMKLMNSYVYEYDDKNNLIKEISTYINEYEKNTTTYEYEYDEYNNVIKKVYHYSSSKTHISEYENKYDEFGFLIEKKQIDSDSYVTYEYDHIYNVLLSEKHYYQNKCILIIDYKYELVSNDSKYVGLNENAIVYVSHDAPKQVRKRKVTVNQIKVRTTPTTHEDNYHKDLVYKDDVVSVYTSIFNDGYTWYEIGVNRWIADDGTWTESVD